MSAAIEDTGRKFLSSSEKSTSQQSNKSNDSPDKTVIRNLRAQSVREDSTAAPDIKESQITEEFGDKSGIMYKRTKSFLRTVWREKFFILLGGSLFFYDNYNDQAPRGAIHFKDSLVGEVNDPKLKKKCMILIRCGKTDTFIAARDQKEKEEWIAAIKSNLNKDPSPPPDKNFIRKKQRNGLGMQSKLVDAATRFGPGKKIITEFVTEDTLKLLECLRSFVTKYESKEKAEEIEKQIVSLGFKVALLYAEKKVTREYFLKLRDPLHALCDKLIDSYELPFLFNAREMREAIEVVRKLIEQIFRPYFSEKAMGKMEALFDYFSNEDLLKEFFAKRKHQECAEMGETLRKLWDSDQV